ncbi:unnamed protein product [Calicophoron daubneyi]|uniref:G-protein coupled receptors family 1 profile domain-containing protein n=1 Tax=Calicophoron daubneyi TaxID=300641 RepID=A0AAV2TBZ1_CALDB
MDYLNANASSGDVNCDVYEKEYASFPTAVTSSCLLILLGILGSIGNILVILVYCAPSRRRISTPYIVITPASEPNSLMESLPTQSPAANRVVSSKKSRHRRPRKFAQTYLIFVLAMVDLIACMLVLPWDVARSLRFVVEAFKDSEATVRMVNITLVLNDEDSPIVEPFLRLSSSGYTMDEILYFIRNLVFACEGSILAAIATERFLLVACRSHMTYRQSSLIRKPDKRSSLTSATRNDEDYPQTDNINLRRFFYNEKKSPSERMQIRAYLTEESKVAPKGKNEEPISSRRYWFASSCLPSARRYSCPWSCMNSTGYACKTRIYQQTIIWVIIVTPCSFVFFVELATMILHFQTEYCQQAHLLRSCADKAYILFTLISFLLIGFFYFQVFSAARLLDIHEQKRSHKHGLMESPRETSSTLSWPSGHHHHRQRESGLRTKSVSEPSPSDVGIEDQTLFNLPRNMKSVSFSESMYDDYESTSRDTSGLPDQTMESGQPRIIAHVPKRPAKSKHRWLRSRRTGLMLFTTTVVFYLTLLPFLIVHIGWWAKEVRIQPKEVYRILSAGNQISAKVLPSELRASEI